eukprot:CAMPEP_0117681488 /NCGR_PEP_ID=MMETSP0804-20121206/19018_1 /TAXON_ID=1074897 /ORGANISM="Tetraselmis astigmatica, Strain CCMP880" /LENGTH=70 /DNA_ID=CAMNT_0005491267 /DNA_START=88 /DNA_END=300 /DNA_ORIENTATION=+
MYVVCPERQDLLQTDHDIMLMSSNSSRFQPGEAILGRQAWLVTEGFPHAAGRDLPGSQGGTAFLGGEGAT